MQSKLCRILLSNRFTISQRRLSHLIVFTILLAIITACSAGRTEQAMEAPAASAPMGYADSDGEAAMTESVAEEAALSADNLAQDAVPIARKIIARATMTIVVEDTDAIVNSIQQELNRIGGYVSQANLYRSRYGGDERLQGNMTLRVPAEELESVMMQLEQMAVEVNDKTINREDITDQYSDVDARLRNLQSTENELREMLAEVRAKPDATPEDILTVYRHLTEIRGQIEQAQGRKNTFDNLVSLSSLELSLTPNWTTIPVVEEGWQPSRTIRNASRELVGALQDLADAAIWFIIFLLPILLLIAIPFVIIVIAIRALWRWLRRGKNKRMAATEE